MDSYSDHTNNKHLDKSSYVKKITQILLSVSVFSFSLSQSSLFVQSYDYFVSNFNFNFKLFSYTTERNCIFLLCNGILVLIIQSSGVITPEKMGPKEDHHGGKDEGIERFQENEKKGLGKDQILEEKRSEKEAEGEEGEDLQSHQIKEEEEEEEGIDADELKKKFEDFIKKMKQQILCA